MRCEIPERRELKGITSGVSKRNKKFAKVGNLNGSQGFPDSTCYDVALVKRSMNVPGDIVASPLANSGRVPFSKFAAIHCSFFALGVTKSWINLSNFALETHPSLVYGYVRAF